MLKDKKQFQKDDKTIRILKKLQMKKETGPCEIITFYVVTI